MLQYRRYSGFVLFAIMIGLFAGLMVNFVIMVDAGPLSVVAAFVAPVMLSPTWMAFLRLYMGPDDENMPNMFNPHTQSWAFLGDFFALPTALAGAASAYSALGDGWWAEWWYLLVSLLIAIAVTVAWRRWQVRDYTRNGEVDRLYIWDKLWHDIAVYLGLSWPLVYCAYPVVKEWVTPGAYWVVGGFGLWVLLSAADALRGSVFKDTKWGLRIPNLHGKKRRDQY